MRRVDRERTDQEFINSVLKKAETLYLALFDDEYPYCLPVNFAHDQNRLFVHSAREGHKLDCIRKNPHVAFSAAIDVQIDQARFTTYYKSVAGKGMASIIDDLEEKRQALDLVGAHYAALCKRPAPDTMLERVDLVRIDIVAITGKANEAPAS